MNPAIHVLLGAFLVGTPASLVLIYLWGEARDTQARLDQALERLYQAKMGGADIPDLHDDSLSALPIEPLPPRLQAIVMSWESDASQQAAESQIRKWLSEGWTVDKLVSHYNPNGDEDE